MDDQRTDRKRGRVRRFRFRYDLLYASTIAITGWTALILTVTGLSPTWGHRIFSVCKFLVGLAMLFTLVFVAIQSFSRIVGWWYGQKRK
jgi:hypothetical protein